MLAREIAFATPHGFSGGLARRIPEDEHKLRDGIHAGVNRCRHDGYRYADGRTCHVIRDKFLGNAPVDAVPGVETVALRAADVCHVVRDKLGKRTGFRRSEA